MTFYQSIEFFMQEQKFRGNSDFTIEYYNNSLGLFKRWCAMDFDVRELCISNYNEFKLFLLKLNTITRISVNTYLRGVKAFLRWLADEQYIDDFTLKIKLVKAERNVILPLSDVEINTLINYFDNSVLGIRNLCIVLLMLDSGLRRNEVVKLDLLSVKLKEKYLIADGKGLKQRIIPLGDLTLLYLQKYIDVRHNSKSDRFFLTCHYKPITNNTVKMVFQRLKVSTGISRIRPHLLRHTFATRYIINGGNLETLRILLGHSSITITQIYLHLATTQNIISMQHISLVDKMQNAN